MLRFLIPLLVAVLLLPACSLPAKKVEQVDAKVNAARETGLTCFPRDIDRCALPSPVLELGRTARIDGQHRLTLVEYGERRPETARAHDSRSSALRGIAKFYFAG